MILLVNKQSVSFIKLKAYMSTAGLPDLLNDLLQCTGISDALQGKIKEKTEGLAKKSKNNSEETQGSSDNAGDSSGTGDSSSTNNSGGDSSGKTGGNDSSGGKDGGGKKEKNKDFKKPTEAMGLKDEQGFLKADYGEHCLYLMLLGTNQDQYLMRLQNLVQLEAKEKYKEKTEYHLSKAYTGITATTEYQLNEFVPITKSTGGFKLDCTKTLGY